MRIPGGLVKIAPNSKPGNKNLNNRVLKMFLKKKKPFHYAAKAETPVLVAPPFMKTRWPRSGHT